MGKSGLGPARNKLFIAAAAGIVLVIVALSYRQWTEYALANAEAARSRQIIESVDRLLLALVDAETGQRGFLLTDEDRYLQPYNQAVQAIPIALAQLEQLLASSPAQAANISRLKDLVNEKLSELRQTIALRQTQGIAAALGIVRSDEGKRRMDEIRRVCAEIQSSETALQNQAFRDREAAAGITLLATIGGSLILLFFLAFGIDPVAIRDPQPRSWLVTYGTAVVATIVATLLRLALSPLIGDTAVPFITFFPAVLFSAWFGGFRVGAFSIVLSTLTASYYFVAPTKVFPPPNPGDQITVLIFVVVGFGMSLLSHSQRRALERARRAEFAEHTERQQFETTLASIGDGVIATDSNGHVTFINEVAESLTGWKRKDAVGRSIENVFQIVNEDTRRQVESPALRAMREGRIVGLANHTVLLSRNGPEIPIDDSGSPIKDAAGKTAGAVLIFRNIAERRRSERERELLAQQARMLDSGFDAIIVRDAQDQIVSWNRIAEELYGWTAEEVIGRGKHGLLKTIFPKPLVEITQDLHRDGRWKGELIHTRKDGNSLTVLSHWMLERDVEGQPRSTLEINIDISARKQAEQDLREQREWLRVTLSSIGDAVIATDRDGRVTFLNPVAESLTGWSEKDALGQSLPNVFQIVNEQTRRPVENPALRAMREGVTVGLANHTVLVSKDGSERPIDDAGSSIRDAQGKMLGAVLIFRDATERRLLERAQAEFLENERNAREEERRARIAAETAELRLQLALDAGRMGTWQYGIRTGEVIWSTGLEQIHGYEPGTFPGTFEAFRKEIHPEDRDRVLSAIRGAIEQQRDHHLEYRIVRSDGSTRWVEGRGQLFLDADGNPDRMVGVCVDTTERRQVEERFRLAVEGAPSAMIMVDPKGTIAFANPSAEQLLGYRRHEMTGLPVERLVPERFRTEHLQFRANYSNAATQRSMGAGRDLYAVRKDGSEVPVEIGLSPIQTADSNFVISAITDITARKRAIEAETQARRAAEEANHAKDEFLAMLSHELRNPLSSILGWADILKSGRLPVERARHALEVIERNARVEVQLVESLLDLSRIAAGKLKLGTERVDLSSLAAAVADSLQPAAQAKGLTLAAAASSGPVVVIGDSGRLQQILSNLLTNAIKFTPRGGRVELRLNRAGSQAQIEVIDDGEGIDADFLPHIFDRFRQAEGSKGRAYGGLGLGLAIVRELVHAHGGTVVADSRGKGQGSTFKVTLPIPAVMPTHNEPAHLQSTQGEEPSISGVRVLVVDDNVDARELLALTLRTRGAVIQTASSTVEALDSIREGIPDVMVADIGMPHEDGYVLIRKLRGLESERNEKRLPAIALTAYASVADREQALADGYDFHLAKPVSISDLAHAVARFRRSHGTANA